MEAVHQLLVVDLVEFVCQVMSAMDMVCGQMLAEHVFVREIIMVQAAYIIVLQILHVWVVGTARILVDVIVIKVMLAIAASISANRCRTVVAMGNVINSGNVSVMRVIVVTNASICVPVMDLAKKEYAVVGIVILGDFVRQNVMETVNVLTVSVNVVLFGEGRIVNMRDVLEP